MSGKDRRFVSATSLEDELKGNSDPAILEQREYRKNIAYTTQDIVDKLDQQRLRDIELEFMRKATREELEYSIQKLDNHAICSGNVTCPKDVKCGGCSTEEEELVLPIQLHGEDCHCSKCCPNPSPTWFQKNKFKVLSAIVFLCVLILSIGWLPSGESYEALQKAYVELIVSLPKMALLSIAGFAIFKIAKHTDKEDKSDK